MFELILDAAVVHFVLNINDDDDEADEKTKHP
jgi:hypothetical protein